MKWALNQRAGFPPGGFYYKQTEGIPRDFSVPGDITSLVALVSDFRTANGLPRAGWAECLEDIIQFTCQRLGGQEPWCFQVNVPMEETHDAFSVGKGCGTCGAKV